MAWPTDSYQVLIITYECSGSFNIIWFLMQNQLQQKTKSVLRKQVWRFETL